MRPTGRLHLGQGALGELLLGHAADERARAEHDAVRRDAFEHGLNVLRNQIIAPGKIGGGFAHA